MGRIAELMESGTLFEALGVPCLTPASDRVMLCGSPPMQRDLKQMLAERAVRDNNASTPGDFVVERAHADQGPGGRGLTRARPAPVASARWTGHRRRTSTGLARTRGASPAPGRRRPETCKNSRHAASRWPRTRNAVRTARTAAAPGSAGAYRCAGAPARRTLSARSGEGRSRRAVPSGLASRLENVRTC